MHTHTRLHAQRRAHTRTHTNTYTCTSIHLKKKVQEKPTGILKSLGLEAEFNVKGEFLRMSQLTPSDLRKEDGYGMFFLLCCLCMFGIDTVCPLWTFSVSGSKMELRTMVQERWASPQVPVLILSCIPMATSLRLPAVDVVEALELSSFSRPWMVSGLHFLLALCPQLFTSSSNSPIPKLLHVSHLVWFLCLCVVCFKTFSLMFDISGSL